MANHRDTHPTDVPGCFGCKALGVRIDSGAAKAVNSKDRTLSADLDAYKRLRNDGLQPKQIDGAAQIEREQKDQFGIDLGRYVPKEERSRVEEGHAIAKEMFA